MSTRTSLFDAINNTDILTLNSLIQSGSCDINVSDSEDCTPLHRAIEKGSIAVVRCLINQNDSVINKQNSDGNTPLHIAVQGSNIDIVECMMNLVDCDVNIKNSYGYTPLHLAILDKQIDIVRCMLDSTNFDVNERDSRGDTPLHFAVEMSGLEIVRCIINRTGCDVNVLDRRGDAPLHIAVQKSDLEIVSCLLDQRYCDVRIWHLGGDTVAQKSNFTCDVNIKNRGGDTPLHLAIWRDYNDIAKCLLHRTDCDVNVQNSFGFTPLHRAVQKSNIEIIRCIVEKGNCDVNIKNFMGHSPFSSLVGETALYKIVKCKNVEIVDYLIQHNVDFLTNQLQLVEFILSENDFQSLWFFIQNGLYINSLTSSGENIVHLLAQFYIDYLYIDFCFLFDYGLDFNLVNNDGNSPLMVASLLNNSPFIQFLAALPCDVNKQNHQGHTSLHLCVIGFTVIKEKLNMMKINSVVKELCAFEYYPKYLACIDTLLDLGADVNKQDIGGKTVLMLACIKHDRKLLETLLVGGADVNIVDSRGRSALQYIDLTNNVYDLSCFNLLLSHGCRQSFNQPWLNGNTIIQNVLKFTPLWQIDDTVNFIKFLVFKNVNLQLLTSDDGEISYGQLSLEEFSSESRHELRQILYLSGGSFVQITQILQFEVEENYAASLPETSREKPREKFYLFANNLSLEDICRRVIRLNMGLAIHDRITELLGCRILADFLMFKDIDSERFSLPVQLESFIDDDYDDDYDSYDFNQEHDDYENDYVMYIDCKYLNEEPSGLKRPPPLFDPN